MSTLGLVLSGGGARAAYQVGALKALAGILEPRGNPFPVIAGSSAGAINGAALAAESDDFPRAVKRLEEIWLSLTPDRVYRTDLPSLSSIGLRWFASVTAGGISGRNAVNHLLDTAPLRALLSENLDLATIPDRVQSGVLRALAISSTNYQTGTAITWFDGVPGIEPWVRSSRLGRRERLTVDHLLASSAIPVFFPPISVHGTFFGDGDVRLTAPLSPAIHLGSEKLIALSVRYYRSAPETTLINQGEAPKAAPALAQIAGVLLNSIFLDALDADVERLERINRTLTLIPEQRLDEVPYELKTIPVLVLRPSRDLGELVSGHEVHLPATLRYLLRGLGVRKERGADLLSYLAFEQSYVEKLIDLGVNDTLARAEELRAFCS
jgi:NTE family protein